MSKLAIGCVGLLAVGVVGGAGASYYAYHRVTSAIAPVAELASLGDIERSIRNHDEYTPPASGQPSRAQVDGLLSVQQAVRARLVEECLHVGDVRREGSPAKDSVVVTRTPLGLSAKVDSWMPVIPFAGAAPEDPGSFVERVDGRCDVHTVG